MIREIREHIDSYLVGRSSLRDLESWVLSNLQTILSSGDETAIDIANQIDADLVELSEQLTDEITLRGRFAGYVARSLTLYGNIPQNNHVATISGGTSDVTTKRQWKISIFPEVHHLSYDLR